MSENLESYCLKTIVDEFERYFLSFSTSEDRETQRKFEFLQRKYSFDILSRLFTEDEMQDKYIDFLINKYLKVLDTRWFSGCSWDTVIEKFVEIGSNIEKIYIYDTYFEEYSEGTPWNDIMQYLPNLSVFSFQHYCEDKILKSIAAFCPNIVEIDLTRSCVTNDGVKNLCAEENGKLSCTKLKNLCIASTNVKSDGVKYLLKNLPSLEVIVYPELPLVLYSLHKHDLSVLDKVCPYNINSLHLLHFDLILHFNKYLLTDVLKICVSVCPNLKCLTCPLMDENHLDLISKLDNLEKLHLECYSDSDIDINKFLKSKGRKLYSLAVHDCKLSISVLSKSCPLLKELCVTNVTFCYDDSKPVFQCLETLTVDGGGSVDDFAHIKAVGLLLSSSPKLECISFKYYNLSSSKMNEHILRCCENYPIKKLDFCFSFVDVEFVKDILLNCHSLKCLNLGGCDFESNVDTELCKIELYELAEILPNKPILFYTEESSSDHDDALDDYLNINDDFDYDEIEEEEEEEDDNTDDDDNDDSNEDHNNSDDNDFYFNDYNEDSYEN